MLASTSVALNTKIGMSEWPETIPSASDSEKVLDRIAARQSAEWRRLGMRTVALLADRMTTRAIMFDEHLALVGEILLGGRAGYQLCPASLRPRNP
jgi:hypothetical protein